MKNKKKKHHLHIELTEQQYNLLRENCKMSGLTMRLYIARLIEGTLIKARPSAEIKEWRTEVHKIGSNINQIARSFNSGIATPEMAQQVLFLLGKVYEIMYLIAKRWQKNSCRFKNDLRAFQPFFEVSRIY